MLPPQIFLSAMDVRLWSTKEGLNLVWIEESGKLKVANELIKLGKKVIIKGCKEMIIEVKKNYGNIFEYEICKLEDDSKKLEDDSKKLEDDSKKV